MKEIVTNGMRFNGMGYVALSRTKLGLRPNKTDIQLQFQTFSESGLLVYMSDYKRDFLSIELKDGRVVFQYDLGGGAVTMEGQDRLNNGEWHSITVSRSKQRGLLRVDNEVGELVGEPGVGAWCGSLVGEPGGGAWCGCTVWEPGVGVWCGSMMWEPGVGAWYGLEWRGWFGLVLEAWLYHWSCEERGQGKDGLVLIYLKVQYQTIRQTVNLCLRAKLPSFSASLKVLRCIILNVSAAM